MSDHFMKIVLFGALVTSCGGDDAALVDEVVAEMGGSTALRAVQSIAVEASGENIEPGQGPTPEQSVRASTYRFTHTFDMASGSARTEWALSTEYFFPPRRFEFTEISSGEVGYVDGVDGHVVQEPRSPMPSNRTGAVAKQERLSNPVQLVRDAAADPGNVRAVDGREHDGKLHPILAITDGTGPGIEIFIDPDTRLPARVETVEDDPVMGDVVVAVLYDDWREIDGVKVPFSLTHQLDGATYRTETRSAVTINPATASDAFDVPDALRTPHDAALATLGDLSHAYFRRWQGLGLPFYLIQDQATLVPVEGADGVFWVTGGGHHSMVIEMDDHLILAEAPLYEARSNAIIAALEGQFPDKPVRYVVVTHHHHDHIGGARTFVARGATLVVPAAIEPFVDGFLDAPHTVRPDALSGSNIVADVMTASDQADLGDSTRAVEVRVMATAHCGSMLVVWLPEEGILFQSDMFSPGLLPPGAPAVGEQRETANELLDFIAGEGLAVQALVAGHGFAVGTLDQLNSVAGRN